MKISRGSARSRADKLRMKRVKQDRVARSRAAEISRNMAAKPAIVSRTNIGTPVFQRASTRVKRRYTFSIDKAGSELIIPGLPMLKVGWRLLSGTMVIFMAFILLAFIKAPSFIVRSSQIKGLSSYEISDIESVINVTGMRIYEIDPNILQKRLSEVYPEIMALNVQINFPSQVVVSGAERTPVVTWKYGDSAVWIDNDGVIFPARGEPAATIVVGSSGSPPLLLEDTSLIGIDNNGLEGEEVLENSDSLVNKRIDKTIFDAVLRIGKQMPEGFMLSYDTRTGLGWSDPRGWYVSFGTDLSDLNEKFMVYETILKEFTAKNIQPTMISVEQLHSPYYRME